MIFSKKTTGTTSIPKIGNIHSGVWKLYVKNSQNCQFCPKNGQILNIFEFPRHVEYDFFKEDHKNNFHTNKKQYDWFPGKSQNSKKFSAKFKQNPTMSKNHRGFLNILGG